MSKTAASGLFLASFLLFALSGHAQEQCGTVEHEQLYHTTPKADFERWLFNKQMAKDQTQEGGDPPPASVYVVPVVVHVVHNGEPYGEGGNIPDERIIGQLERLNQDFRRTNEDAVNTPTIFEPVAADVEVQFVLAKQDPEGLATSGIVRVQGSRQSYSPSTHPTLSADSFWPSEDYMNIWVTALTDENVLGFAALPESSLPGLSFPSSGRLTDGVVVNYPYFGANDNGTGYNLGRTLTHEVGHFLGLRHIWGDGDCGSDDFVADTPSAQSSSFGCPVGKTTCETVDMVQNYMDYSDDACMNLFTQGQKSRMRTVLENSPRRLSLLSSPALQEPAPQAYDLGIRSVTNRAESICDGVTLVQAEVRNYGTQAINGFTVELRSQQGVEQEVVSAETLAPLDIVTVDFSSLPISEGEVQNLTVALTDIGAPEADQNNNNAEKSLRVAVPIAGSFPVAIGFSEAPEGWETINPDESITWAIRDTENGQNPAIHMDFFNYSPGKGAWDYWVSPKLDLTNAATASLHYRYAYAPYPGAARDELAVFALTQCAFDPAALVGLDYVDRNEMPTAEEQVESFVPSTRFDWRPRQVDLSSLLGQAEVRLVLAGRNQFGNNLYVDDVTIASDPVVVTDVRLLDVVSPGSVICRDRVAPSLHIQNKGVIPLTQLQVCWSINSQEPSCVSRELQLLSGEKAVVALPEIHLPAEVNTIDFEVVPTEEDANPSDNTLRKAVTVQTEDRSLPFFEDFEHGGNRPDDWTVRNADSQLSWSVATTAGLPDGQHSMAMRFFDYVKDPFAPGAVDELHTPIINLLAWERAELSFDLSYGGPSWSTDQLQVLASETCGITYAIPLLNNALEQLVENENRTPFTPDQQQDWQTVRINLSSLVGRPFVRIAFVATNGFGNNLFLDNVRIEGTQPAAEVQAGQLRLYPNPTSSTVNVPIFSEDEEPVSLRVIDSYGREVISQTRQNVGGTIRLDIRQLTPGIYQLQLRSSEGVSTGRFVVVP